MTSRKEVKEYDAVTLWRVRAFEGDRMVQSKIYAKQWAAWKLCANFVRKGYTVTVEEGAAPVWNRQDWAVAK